MKALCYQAWLLRSSPEAPSPRQAAHLPRRPLKAARTRRHPAARGPRRGRDASSCAASLAQRRTPAPQRPGSRGRTTWTVLHRLLRRGPGPRGQLARRPPPARAAHFRLQRGDALVDVKCADEEPMKACADLALQMVDRLQTAEALIPNRRPGSVRVFLSSPPRNKSHGPRRDKHKALSGEVTDIFAHRFVLKTADGKVLADLGPEGAEQVLLTEGDRVELWGELKPSEIKVHSIARTECRSSIERPREAAQPPHEHG